MTCALIEYFASFSVVLWKVRGCRSKLTTVEENDASLVFQNLLPGESSSNTNAAPQETIAISFAINEIRSTDKRREKG